MDYNLEYVSLKSWTSRLALITDNKTNYHLPPILFRKYFKMLINYRVTAVQRVVN